MSDKFFSIGKFQPRTHAQPSPIIDVTHSDSAKHTQIKHSGDKPGQKPKLHERRHSDQAFLHIDEKRGNSAQKQKRTRGEKPQALEKSGAGGGGRTPTGVTPADFESAASAIPPLRRDETRIFYNMTAFAAIAEMAAMFERRRQLC